MKDILVSAVGVVVGWVGEAGAGVLVGFLVTAPFLPKLVSTARRAWWMKNALSTVYDAFIVEVKATPNKYDDAAMAFVSAMRDWAAKQEKRLTDAEHAKAREFIAKKIANDVALAPLRVSASK